MNGNIQNSLIDSHDLGLLIIIVCMVCSTVLTFYSMLSVLMALKVYLATVICKVVCKQV